MKSESEYNDELDQLYDSLDNGRGQRPSVLRRLMALSQEAVTAYPDSAPLWCVRGEIYERITLDEIFRGPEASDDTLHEAIESYLKALELDPGSAQVNESIGWCYDATMDNPSLAEGYFRRAIASGGGASSYVGLAQVLAELGKKAEALELLSSSECPFSEVDEVIEMRREITEGLWG